MKRIALELLSGKDVGWTEGELAVLPVGNKNWLGLAKGYSVDAAVFDEIKRRGCSFLEFRTQKGRWLRMAVDLFGSLAKRYDFGYGVKLACSHAHYADVTPDDGAPAVLGGYAAV